MFKKILYSLMALSLTMCPATQADPIDSDTEISVGQDVNLNAGTSSWTGGTITNTGGTLTINGYHYKYGETSGCVGRVCTTTKAPNYVQEGGNLEINPNAGAIGGLTLQGTSINAAAIKAGTVSVGYATTGDLTNNTLILGDYSYLSSGVNLTIEKGNILEVNSANAAVVGGSAVPTLTLGSNVTWDGNITLTDGTINLASDVSNADTSGETPVYGTYTQTGGRLNVEGHKLSLGGVDTALQTISGGEVYVGTTSAGTLNLNAGSKIESGATVNIGKSGTIALTGQQSGAPTLVLDSSDTWNGTITNTVYGYLSLQGYNNTPGETTATTAVYQQARGTLDISNNSNFWIRPNNAEDGTTSSYISSGDVHIFSGSTMNINATTTNEELYGTLNDLATVMLDNGATLAVNGTGTAVLNDIITTADASDPGENDRWLGQVVVGSDSGTDDPVLALQNIGIDFVNEKIAKNPEVPTTAVYVQKNGLTAITADANGGSDITINNVYGYDSSTGRYYNSPASAPEGSTVGWHSGLIRVGKLDPQETTTDTSKLTINYVPEYTPDNFNDFVRGLIPEEEVNISAKPSLNMSGNGSIVINTNGKEIDYISSVEDETYNYITGSGANNSLTVNGDSSGNGSLVIYDDRESGINIGSNVTVNNGSMVVMSGKTKIGVYADDSTIGDVTSDYGNLTLNNSTYDVYSTENVIVGDLTLNNSWMNYYTPSNSTTTVGGDLTTGSGINMMNGSIDTMNVAGDATINDLNLKIDINPVTMQYDKITASNVFENGPLTLSDYNILDTNLTKDFYRFNVIQGTDSYTVGSGASKTVSGNAATQVVRTKIGDYKLFASSANGAYDMALYRFNPEVFRGQVATNVIYANQLAITNQLFDRMMYSVLPYFNAKCANKVAAADTLYSPYQYTMSDPGLWFKPYANFETIHMNYGLGKVRNNAYGAMIGADFAKKEWGNWTFIPTAYIGYNGGHTTYNGVGMWHNGGQGGLMGTLTNRDFVTMFTAYAGGYGNSMYVGEAHDKNALWNTGVAAKAAYNLHLPWDFILQPTVYMAYNYVGASSWNSEYDGFKHKVKGLNAYSVAPGLNLIWQKETFSLYATFQAMFNVGSTAAGRVAEIDLPHVGIRDPYFEYGLGASKYFKDRFSGYGQVTARSGSRKGVGFQLGLNVKI